MAWLVVLGVIALPVIEITLFVRTADWIGGLPTIALAIFFGMAGIALLRHQGLATLMRARTLMEHGRVPLGEAFDGLCLAFAGVMFLLPGFLTDAIGVLLLLPPVRAALRWWVARHLRSVVVATQPSRGQPAGPTVIEADYRVLDRKE